MDDPASLPPHERLKLNATPDPDAHQEASLSDIQEEDSVPPRKKFKKDAGRPVGSDQLLNSSRLLPRALGEEHSLILAQIMDQCRMQQHKEEDVGITEFVNPSLLGFTGIIKKRYTDFIVNEILPNGEVVHLTSLRPPKFSKDSSSEVALTEGAARAGPKTADVQESPKTEAVDAIVPENEAVKPDSTPEFIVRSMAEELRLKSNEDVANVNASEAKSEVKYTDDGIEPEESPKTHLAIANIVDATTQKPDTVAAVTAGEVPAESTGPGKSDAVSSVDKWQQFASQPKDFKISSADVSALSSFFELDVIEQITALCNRIANSPHRKPKDYGQVRTAPIKDREARTKIHQELRRIYKSYLESYTDDTGAMIISAASTNTWNKNVGARGGWPSQNSGRNSGSQRQKASFKPGWKDLGGDYLHFTLYKENKDTMEVVSYLARSLKLGPQSFQFAGTKDRRGVTTQRVSVYRVYADRVVPIGKTLRNAKIGNYSYEPRGLELGELMGNEFVITLRDCQLQLGERIDSGEHTRKAIEDVQKAAKVVSERGFLNYFGLQRFGTFSTRTDTIGKRMLQGDFKGAVEAILNYHPAALEAAQDGLSNDDTISFDDKNRAAAIHSFQTTHQSRLALETLPRKFSAEAAIIRHLGVASRANDYQAALQGIPKNLRLMYVHAYQSLIWNLAASHRWQHCGDKLLVGDLVLVNEHKDKSAGAKESEQIDADGEVIIRPAANDSAALEEDRFIRARHLTADDIVRGQYSIYDIVLPTPGFDILYPDNIMRDFYEKTMASDLGGQLNPHDMRRSWKDISLSGSYRKLLAKPMGEIYIQSRLYSDSEHEVQFVQTDMERMFQHTNQPGKSQPQQGDAKGNGKSAIASNLNTTPAEQQEAPRNEESSFPSEEQLATGAENGEHTSTGNKEGASIGGPETSAFAEHEPKEPTPPQKLAFIVKMQLGSSQYATMALRELMKLGVRTYKPDLGGGR